MTLEFKTSNTFRKKMLLKILLDISYDVDFKALLIHCGISPVTPASSDWTVSVSRIQSKPW